MTETEFLSTMGDSQPADLDGEAPCDFWAYFDALPETVSRDFDDEQVFSSHVTCGGLWQHILLGSLVTPNVFLVIVVDLTTRTVRGHRVLNLNNQYGLGAEADDLRQP